MERRLIVYLPVTPVIKMGVRGSDIGSFPELWEGEIDTQSLREDLGAFISLASFERHPVNSPLHENAQ